MYKWEGGWEGVGWAVEGGWAVGGRLNPLIGLFGPAIYESKKWQPWAQTHSEGLRDISLPLG